jgi:hypothetical protein
MSNPSVVLRGGNAGPSFDPSTPGHVLVIDSDGRSVKPVPFASAGVDASEVANDSTTVAGANVAVALDNLNKPFRASYWVNPAFAGVVSTGSEASPFKTIAAAFAAAVALGITAAVVNVPANATIVEDVVFPAVGAWEITSPAKFGYIGALIQGTVTINSSQAAQFALTNVQVTGNVTGNATGAPASRLRLSNAILNANLTLTGTAAAVWRVLMDGSAPGPVGMSGAVAGAVAVTGAVFATGFGFFSTIAVSVASQFLNSVFNNGNFAGNAGGLACQFYACAFFAAGAFTATTGTLSVQLDGATAASLAAVGYTAGANVTVKTLNANGSARATVANNVGVTALTARVPLALMVCEATLTILTPGTLGSAVLNVTYTDLAGTVVTKAVTTALDITGAAGTEVKGSFQFSQNGATGIQYSVTGITTPGALSLSVGVAVRQAS